ncbi:hypothetical protein ACJJTC_004970 [Scirpophaga incertulas]
MSKRKKKEKDKPPDDENTSLFSSSEDDAELRLTIEQDCNKYKPYMVTDYNRRYPEDSASGYEYVVFINSNDDQKPIGTRDMLSLSGCFQRFVKGIKYLKKVNKFKIGVVFDKPNLAFLDNTSFLKDQDITASIPASSTELMGVITVSNYFIERRGLFFFGGSSGELLLTSLVRVIVSDSASLISLLSLSLLLLLRCQ